MAAAAPYLIVGGLGALQYQQQGAAGKFNQAVQNRNAQLSEQEAAQMAKQLEFDLVRFDQKFQQLEGQTITRIAKTGADFSGTGLRILRANAEEAELEKNIMEYNSQLEHHYFQWVVDLKVLEVLMVLHQWHNGNLIQQATQDHFNAKKL
jgi:CheY-like chemotaxis protein